MSFLPSADLPVKLTRQFSFSILYRSSHLYRAGMQESVWFWNYVSMALLEHGRAVYTCNDILSWTWPSRQRPPSDGGDDDEVDGNDDDIVDLPGNRATSEWGSLQSGQLHVTWPILNSFLSDNTHRFDCFFTLGFPSAIVFRLFICSNWLDVGSGAILFELQSFHPLTKVALRSICDLNIEVANGAQSLDVSWMELGGGPRDL